MTTPTQPTPIEVSRPTVQFTTRAQPALVQFQRKSPRDGTWKPESFHPTQAELAAHEAETTPGAPAGYWGDAGVEAATLAYLAEEYGITNAVIVDPTEIAIGVSLIMGALSLLGFRRESPATAIAAIAHTVDSLGRRADRSDSTLVKLTDRLTFTNYMLCIQAKNSPTPLGAKASTDCDAIIQQRLAP
jgi:hypothetical protein